MTRPAKTAALLTLSGPELDTLVAAIRDAYRVGQALAEAGVGLALGPVKAGGGGVVRGIVRRD